MSAESAIREITKSSAAIKAAERREVKALKELITEIVSLLNDIVSTIIAHGSYFGRTDQNTQLVALRQKIQKAQRLLELLDKLDKAESENFKKIVRIGPAVRYRLSVFDNALSAGDITSYTAATKQFNHDMNALEEELITAFSTQIKIDKLRLVS